VRIVVLDGHTLNPGDNPWDELATLGELTVYPRSAPDEVVARASAAEVVLTNKTHLDAATLAALPDLRFVAVLATGYDVVDVAAARAHGIRVANVPEYGTDSVAQHVLALVLELASAVGEHDAAVHAGEWQRCPDFSFWHRPLLELAGLTMGIVGFGRIGQRVGELANAFGMRVLASRRPGGAGGKAAPWPGFAWCPVEELFATADVVSLHCPLTADNAGFVGDALLARMKRSAFLINTARGPLVDEDALARALAAGGIAGAALDVVSAEPIRPDNPLLRAPNCILTPHIAWASLAARRRLMASAVANVRGWRDGAPVNLVA
jgi:glycerate dehydrogenase